MRDRESYERLVSELNAGLRTLIADAPGLVTLGIALRPQHGLRQATDAMASALAANPLHPRDAIAALSNRHRNVILGFRDGLARRRFHAGDRHPVHAFFQIVTACEEWCNHSVVIDLARDDAAIMDRFMDDVRYKLRGIIAVRRLIGTRRRTTTIDRATLAILKSKGIVPEPDPVQDGSVGRDCVRDHDDRSVIVGTIDGEAAIWKDGVLVVPGSLPETLMASAIGRTLGGIVAVPAPLAERRVKSVAVERRFRTTMGPAGKATMAALLASGPLIHLGGPTPASTGTMNNAFNNDIHVMMLEITVEADRVRIDGPIRRCA